MSHMLARSAGTLVVHEGGRILVADRRTRGATIAVFVLGLVTGILGINGLVQLGLAAAGEGLLALGIAATLVAVATGTITWTLVGRLRARRAEPVRAEELLCAIDLRRQVLLGPNGAVLAPLGRCRLEYQFQLASSSRALAIVTPDGKLTVARGDPFSGDVGPIARALAEAGIQAPR